MREAFTIQSRPVQDPTEAIDQENDEEEVDSVLSGDKDLDSIEDHASSSWCRDCCGYALTTTPWKFLQHSLDPTPWLMQGVEHDSTGTPYFPRKARYTLAGVVRYCFYNPIQPEFTSMQLFCWAVAIGVVMGVYTAAWKMLVESGVDLVWKVIPRWLVWCGFFTHVNGWFPLYHYMWIVPTLFGAALSYAFVILPIPGQNEWISALHKTGVQDHRTFVSLFILSTLGMMSGLSLGPELPLILTSGMMGSWLALACRQSMLQARVLNLTAASAAIGGFFGFPMAGALFVLELPHRSGLQYFEALTPSVLSSIVAVITNRLIITDDVAGYFKYPFFLVRQSTLPLLLQRTR